MELITKNSDPHKYGYNAYSIEFDARSQFSLSNGKGDKSVITFGVDDSSSVHADNNKKLS